MKISIAMTAYNGSKYIKNQLHSILEQINENDEVVIVDDCSTDNTVDIINSFQDFRIKLIENNVNLGTIKNFEKAISNTQGDLIFLSDQDDIWLPNKVRDIVKVFNDNEPVTLVATNAEIIDHKDAIIADSYYQLRGKFTYGAISNIIKNKFLGCTLVFKRKMLPYFLPFPQNIPMHDMWIGILNEIYGKTLFLEKPYIKYRLHLNNASRGPVKYAELRQMIIWRYFLVKNLLYRLWQNYQQ